MAKTQQEMCEHSKAKADDNYCIQCGKQLRDYCYKKCPNCEAWITEEDWKAIPLIHVVLKDKLTKP